MLVSELGLSKSVVDHMAEGSVPSADKLVLIAQYLDTSVAYIIGMTDDEKPTTPGQGQSVRMELRAMIAGIPDDKLGRVKGILQAAIDAVK
ncbi:MAG: hypothetical protein LBI19_07345 [Oscillospiraceae bacterium]|nr:hypothetical protein [Oscillospiraceae bacterium]